MTRRYEPTMSLRWNQGMLEQMHLENGTEQVWLPVPMKGQERVLIPKIDPNKHLCMRG